MKVFKPIPFKQITVTEGMYKVKLKNIKDGVGQYGPYLIMNFSILGEKNKGASASYIMQLYEDEAGKPRVSDKGAEFIKKLAGVEEMTSVDPYDFIGHKYSAIVEPKPAKKDPTKIYNTIKTLLPFDLETEDIKDEDDDAPAKPAKKPAADDDDEEDTPKKKPVVDDDDDDADDDDDDVEPKKKAKDADEDFDE